MTDTAVMERVADGCALLDEFDPDWWEVIDLPSLDLEDPQRCVLGQLSKANWGTPWPGDRFGPFGYDMGFGFSTDGSYPDLTEAWAEAILWREYLSDLGELP